MDEKWNIPRNRPRTPPKNAKILSIVCFRFNCGKNSPVLHRIDNEVSFKVIVEWGRAGKLDNMKKIRNTPNQQTLWVFPSRKYSSIGCKVDSNDINSLRVTVTWALSIIVTSYFGWLANVADGIPWRIKEIQSKSWVRNKRGGSWGLLNRKSKPIIS